LKGVKRVKAKPYMSSNDILEFLKIGCLAGECKKCAEITKKTAKTDQEKDWAKRLLTAATHLGKVTDERIACCEPIQLKTVKRRWKNSDLRLYTTDQLRIDERDKKIAEDRTMSWEDFAFLGEMALLHCELCPQGEFVEDCEYRQTFHRVGIPISRESVKPGQCEFCRDDFMHIVLPHGHDKHEEQIKRMLDKIYEKAKKGEEVPKGRGLVPLEEFM
jgi:hypothetical protein